MTIGRNRKKVAIGVYPLDKISLPIRYLAKKPEEISFIPLESEREMSGKQILQRHPTGIKYAPLLEEYQKYPLFIDSKGKVLSMPPIINSSETGRVTEETHDVFVECSGWHFETLQKTLSILVTSLADMGGKIYGVEIINGKEKTLSPDLTPGKMSISIERINKILGLELKEKDFSQLLPKMGYEYSAGKIKIPSWRVDVLHEVDVAEDVAIAYGYDKFIPHIPEVSTIGEESFSSTLSRKIGEALSGLGLLEISTYHLLKIEEAQQLKKEELLIVENSKTEYKVLRPNLFIPGLRILSENKDREYPQCLYEIGTVFLKDDSGMSETGVCEEEHLFIAGSPKNFTDMKQYLNYLATSLGVTFTLKEGDHSGLIEGRVADIYIQDRYAGYFGEVHPETLRTWGLKMPLVILELNLKDIQKLLDKSDLQ